MNNSTDRRLFWACFIMLITTAFGFVVRTQIMGDEVFAREFGFSDTQKGELMGAWLWPFGVSIILFSLVIDKIGYGNAVIFALICQLTSSVMAIYSKSYGAFYAANVIGALGNGTVEAVINPVVATMFARDKTKWLNILHAGWPGGLVIGGILAIELPKMIGATVPEWAKQIGVHAIWQFKLALVFIPVVLYALLLIGCKFPVNERVAAGVSYRTMLKEAGLLSWLVATSLIVQEVTRVFEQMGYILQWRDLEQCRLSLRYSQLGPRRYHAKAGGQDCLDRHSFRAFLYVRPLVGPNALLLPGHHHDSARHHRARNRRLDHGPDDGRNGQREQNGWHGDRCRLGVGLHVIHHDGLAIFRRPDRPQILTIGIVGHQRGHRRLRPLCLVEIDRTHDLGSSHTLRLRQDFLLADDVGRFLRTVP